MGLDQYAFARKSDNDEKINIAYWRKHTNLQKHMESLYRAKGGAEEFNCVDVNLTEHDLKEIKRLCLDLKALLDEAEKNFENASPEEKTKALNEIQRHSEINGIGLQKLRGVFRGHSDPQDNEDTLKFVDDALYFMSEGYLIFYSSWW